MSRSAPKRRAEKVRGPIETGAAVRIERPESGNELGVVKSLLNVHGHQNVLVQTESGEVVTMGDRVEVVDGVDATQARQNAEVGGNE